MDKKLDKKQHTSSKAGIKKALEFITITGDNTIVAQLGILIMGAYFVSLYSYLLFHTLSEVISVVIAFSVFTVVWNSRRYIKNNYFLIVGIALAASASVDILHTLAYKGMNIFVGFGANLPTQLWLAARLITSASIFAAPFFLKKQMVPKYILAQYAGITVIALISIFYLKIFPTAFVEGVGMTPFKKITEYVICLLLAGGLWGLYRMRTVFYGRVYWLLSLSIVAMILSEFVFTLYSVVTDELNLIGHLLKIATFYFIYLAIVEMGIMKPYRTVFKDLKDSEVALRASEGRYRSLIEYLPSGILVHRDGMILYANPEALRIFGAKKPEELIGRNLFDFICPEFQDDVRERAKHIQSGAIHVAAKEMKVVRLDGQTIDIGSTALYVEYQGEPAVQAVIKDITEKKRVADSLAAHTKRLEETTEDLKKFQLAVSGASDHIVITDIDGHILYANKAVEKITGHSISEIIGKRPSLWGNQMSKDFYEKLWKTIKDEKTPYSGEIVNIRKNGEKYVAQLEVAPLFDDMKNLYGFIGIERDITKMKEIDQAKTEFVSLASHQLRTPLSSISLSAELLLRGVSGGIDERQRQFLETIRESAGQMTELISSLLNISRIELGTFVIREEPMNILEALDKIIHDLTFQISAKKMRVERKYGERIPEILFDRSIFKMICENLIANAVKYTGEGGRVTIEVTQKEETLLVAITDTGCGIPRNQQGEIFTKLFRAENAKEITTEGAGLGLYIAKSVAQKAGAELWFESEENQGTTFFLSIPIKKAAKIEEKAVQEISPEGEFIAVR